MGKRNDLFRRIVAVEREYTALRLAGDRLDRDARRNATILDADELTPRDVRDARRSLEPTYLIRVFAVAEAGWRDVWLNYLRRPSHPPTRTLLDSLAARFRVSQGWLADAHEVRAYRNSLVHEGREAVTVVPLAAAVQRLGRVVSMLPLDW
ncbi:MAG: hypothetical protein U0746_10745 [Gemmataceae bacterium]